MIFPQSCYQAGSRKIKTSLVLPPASVHAVFPIQTDREVLHNTSVLLCAIAQDLACRCFFLFIYFFLSDFSPVVEIFFLENVPLP